jgi:hypothetical protein
MRFKLYDAKNESVEIDQRTGKNVKVMHFMAKFNREELSEYPTLMSDEFELEVETVGKN